MKPKINSIFDKKQIEIFKNRVTPFYFYDIALLKETAQKAMDEANKYGFKVHYALKANSNPKILKILSSMGFGADCVSANEIVRAVECGFAPKTIVYAGVGKKDNEINTALDLDIFTLNCESLPEIEIVNELAKKKNIIADIAIRINPNVDAHTHQYITTGLNENKFGISQWQWAESIKKINSLSNVNLISLHFHIGSQITDIKIFENLSKRINEIVDIFNELGINLPDINVGGGLGINYESPDADIMPNFAQYFNTFYTTLNNIKNKTIHFELGRSIVGQCGSLITKVLYIKEGQSRNFVIVDGGMTDLIRPALYRAHHKIENITSASTITKIYDVVGPICETSDCFASNEKLIEAKRGDLLAVLSAGAYGEIMASRYNLRDLPKAYYSDEQ